MTLRSEVTHDRNAITAITPTPGRMRRALLQFLLVAILLLPFGGCMALQMLMVVDGATLLTPLRLLAESWVFWALCATFVLLFVLDGRSRLKLVWGAESLRTSWLFGPLELFEVERDRVEIGPLISSAACARCSRSWARRTGGSWRGAGACAPIDQPK